MTIIEGARAVGKTSLLAHLETQGHLATRVSLVDSHHLAAATDNPTAWLSSLRHPVGIDEAQLAPDLPLAVKHYMDSHQDQASIILTGSAAIGRTGLGGSDPLARRSTRLTLEPLTASELLGGTPWSAVDALFSHSPHTPRNARTAPWGDWVPHGGLPRYRLAKDPAQAIASSVVKDIEAILTDDVLPWERFDRGTARGVADYILRNPAGEVNLAVAARTVGIDPRSVSRYMDVLVRRFLTRELPNLKRAAKRSSRSTAKFYPSDVALSTGVLLASGTSLADDAVRGGLLETWAVQQLCAHAMWSQRACEVMHYRDTSSGRSVEVDIVLCDAGGGLVGIEVKATNRPNGRHTSGLRALKKAYPERWRRGFVLTTGDAAVPLAEDIWALPIGALVDARWWPDLAEQPAAQAPTSTANAHGSPGVVTLLVDVHPSERDAAYMGLPGVFAEDVAEALTGAYGVAAVVGEGVGGGRVVVLRFVTPRSGVEKLGGVAVASPSVAVGWVAPPGRGVAGSVDVEAQGARTAARHSPEYALALDATAEAVLEALSR